MSAVSVAKLRAAIRKLPADEPVVDSNKWYRTQKEHWLRWLGEYATRGAQDARFAYNHIVEPKMLLYLIEASGLPRSTVQAAKRAAATGKTMMAQSGAIRRQVPWAAVEEVIWEAR